MRAKNRSRATLYGRRGRKRLIKPARVKTIVLPKLAGSHAGVGIEPVPAEAQYSSYDGDTAFHLYLREIGQTPLLTPREEIELARRIRKGDRRAREQMIKANLRLVVKIARDYESYGLPLLDLINEGNIGLMKGVERFDPKKGAKLQLRRAAVRPTSLDAPIGDDDTNRVSDVVKDENADTPYEQLEEKTNNALVHEMIGTLDAREQAILRQRFGLDGDDRKTLEEIGEQFGVTRERIRQIEEIALRKLRKRIQELDTVEVAA